MSVSHEELLGWIHTSTNPGLPRIGSFFCNLGFTPLLVDDDVWGDGRDIGNVDLAFRYGSHVFVIEVSTQREDRNEKINAWFLKWTNRDATRLLLAWLELDSATPIFRIYIDLTRGSSGEGVDLIPRNLRDSASSNCVLFKDDVRYFEDAFAKVKDFARYDLLGYLGVRPERGGIPIDHAIQFYMGDLYALSFVIPAETLLQSAYVFRRRGLAGGYQRFLNFKRIEDIERKIRERRILSFPNSILINMERDVLVDPRRRPEDCPAPCRFMFPTDYCSMRIIDGQHRMMGIARLPVETRRAIDLVVIAFPQLAQEREVRTFVDINNNQNKVDRNLVFNLIADFDWPEGSKESWQKAAVLAARQLRQRGTVPIFFGAADEERKGKIALATLVTTLLTTGLVGGRRYVWRGREFDELYQMLTTVKNPRSRFPVNWISFLISNRGVRVLLRLLYLAERNRDSERISLSNHDVLLRLRDVADDALLTPILGYLGHGGADLALRDIIARLQSGFREELGEFTRDLRLLGSRREARNHPMI